jgi:hypothetical protein
MAVNMSIEVYSLCQDTFGRPVTFTSTTGNSYGGAARGIYNSGLFETLLEDGSIMVEQQTILDIRAMEFAVLPVQDDIVAIPAEPISGLPDEGSFQIIKVTNNGGGEVTLQLRELKEALG